mgnify:CR=1 FL=1
MIKLVCFLKRKEGLTHEEFVDHWKNRHGPLIAGTPSIARHVARYEQLEPSEALHWMNQLGSWNLLIGFGLGVIGLLMTMGWR